MSQYSDILAPFLGAEPGSLGGAEKDQLLLRALIALHQHHRQGCRAYRMMTDALFAPDIRTVADLPFLPVRLLKELELRSVPQEQIVRVLQSSGTSGRAVSRVFLDAATADAQRRALSRVFCPILGEKRLPMLIVDCRASLARGAMSARAAGILGLMNFGRKHVWALDEDLSVNLGRVEAFVSEHAGQAVLIYGLTYLIWQKLVGELGSAGFELPKAVVVHGGGWKKLESLAVTDRELRASLRARFGIERVHDFYGMVEQVGSVFVQCQQGSLHASDFSEVIVRRPGTWSMVDDGEVGALHLVSAIPWSYPGHSLLTEDLGRVTGRDRCPCGRPGTTFEVHGRMPAAELRGCSDTLPETRAE